MSLPDLGGLLILFDHLTTPASTLRPYKPVSNRNLLQRHRFIAVCMTPPDLDLSDPTKNPSEFPINFITENAFRCLSYGTPIILTYPSRSFMFLRSFTLAKRFLIR
jgi:hypothetical protein